MSLAFQLSFIRESITELSPTETHCNKTVKSQAHHCLDSYIEMKIKCKLPWSKINSSNGNNNFQFQIF